MFVKMIYYNSHQNLWGDNMFISNSEFSQNGYNFTKVLGEKDGLALYRINNNTNKKEIFLVYPFIDNRDETKKQTLDLSIFCSQDRKNSIFSEGQVLCDEDNNIKTITNFNELSYLGVWIPTDSPNIDTYLQKVLSTSVFTSYSDFRKSIACRFITTERIKDKTNNIINFRKEIENDILEEDCYEEKNTIFKDYIKNNELLRKKITQVKTYATELAIKVKVISNKAENTIDAICDKAFYDERYDYEQDYSSKLNDIAPNKKEYNNLIKKKIITFKKK